MSPRFDILTTTIDGLLLVQRKPLGDSRGFFERLYCDDELQRVVQGKPISQINHTLTTKRGTVRGMHYQRPPHGEIKFVCCLRGTVLDVAVDLRRDSPTFLRWHAEILSSDNYKTLVIPEGFAHGFQALSDDAEMLYFHTAHYKAEYEGGLHPQDPALAIEWPLPVVELSARDSAHRMITGASHEELL